MVQLQLLQQQQQSNPVSNAISEEQVEELRHNLAQAQEAAENARQEAESLRAPAAIEVSEDVQAEEGPDSVAEQIKLHVEAIRIELEARHDERVNQLEETYKKRAENMRNQLTKKLADGKEQVRQALTAEHEQTLNALRSVHQQELEQLKVRHQDEIAELRRNEETTFSQFKEAWLKEHATAAPEGENALKSETPNPRSPWKPTEAEAREFVSTNATVRSILRSNITTKVKEARDALSVKLTEKHEEILARRLKEVQDKAETAKEHAVYTEGKRFALKLNLADNRSKVAQAKLEVVQRAAQETPERPVGEVWAIAKDAKPPVQAPHATAPLQSVPRPISFGQPTPMAPMFPKHQGSSQPINQGVPAVAETQGDLHSSPHTGTANSSAEPQHPITPAPVSPAEGPTPAVQLATTQPGSHSSLPVKLQPTSTQQQPNAGPGPGTGRGLQQSNLPIARGGLSRGAPNSRGRGQGIGRGGPQKLDTSKPQGPPAGTESPTRGTFSGGARPFVPQSNKRARDDDQIGQDGIDEGNGKRIRGGSAGS